MAGGWEQREKAQMFTISLLYVHDQDYLKSQTGRETLKCIICLCKNVKIKYYFI